MKKIALLLATVLLLMAAMTGCSNTESSSGDGEVYNIKWFQPNTAYKDHDLVFETISEYTKEKIGVTVTQTVFPNAEYSEKIQMMIASGEPMDMLFASGFPDYVSDGVYLELDELLQSHGQDILKTLPEYAWKAVSVDGKIYAVPPLKDWAVHHVLQYFDGLVEKYNMDFSTVQSLADLEPMLQTIKDNEPGVYPLGVTGKSLGLSVFLPVERIEGSVIGAFSKDDYDTVVNLYETDAFKEFFNLMHDWNQKGFFRSDAATGTTVTDLVNAHKIFLLTSESIPYFQEQKNNIEDEGWKTIFDGRLTEPTISTRAVAQACQAIAAGSDNPEKTMAFLNLLYTDADLMNLLVNGIEGQHYTAIGENYYQFPEGVTKAAENDYYGTPAYQGNRFLLRLREGEPEDLWQQYQAFNESATVSPSFGFNFDTTNVMNEITALNNVYQEYIPGLMVGASDPAVQLPAALEKFKIAGSETVVKEIQRQYDEWKANNQ